MAYNVTDILINLEREIRKLQLEDFQNDKTDMKKSTRT